MKGIAFSAAFQAPRTEDRHMRIALRVLAALGGLTLALTALVVALAYDGTDFAFKRVMLLPDGRMLPLGLAAAVALTAALSARLPLRRMERALSGRRGVLLLAAGSCCLFALQLAVCYLANFSGEGDDTFYMLNSAMAVAIGEPAYVETKYLSLYPNNVALTVLYGWTLRLVRALFSVEPGMQRFRVMLIAMQSAMNVLTGTLVAWQAGRLARSRLAALLAWLLYAGLIGLSPWFLVPYSDSTMLFMPLLLIAIWQKSPRSGGRRILRFALLGLLGGLAFLAKPQALIPVVAIALVELAGRGRRGLAGLAALTAGLCLMLAPGNRLLERALGTPLDPEAAIGAASHLNMGLNEQTNGAFSPEDVGSACARKTRAERTSFCLNSAAERVYRMGPAGLLRHAVRKCLVNFADGTFAWGIDFSRINRPEKGALSRLVRDIVYEDGARYRLLGAAQQVLWLLTLLLCPLAALIRPWASGDRAAELTVCTLSCAGLVLFNMLFEAKARYVYVMLPVFIVLAACASAKLARGAKSRLRRAPDPGTR